MFENPVIDRKPAATAAVVFVHGFTGDGVGTWGTFPQEIRRRGELDHVDLYFWEYPSKLSLTYAVTKWFWANDPNIATIGDGLRTMLDTTVGSGYDQLALVAHSMGGLVVQTYVLEELRRIREGTLAEADSMIGKVNEIILYATPSGGLGKARLGSFLKNQIADMSDTGPFVNNLRAEWTQQVEAHRHERNAPNSFRLTLVAGAKDRFVPPESALEPFPLDEHEVVGGDHASLVKPEKVGRQPVDILASRLTRGTPTAEELSVVYGRDPEAVKRAMAALAAAELGDVARLERDADELLAGPVQYPTVERALGLALTRQARHDRAVQLLSRFLDFQLTDGSRPFASDEHAIQQLAIAESGLGHHVDAVARLRSLAPELQNAETLGIIGGRFKRQWIESGARLRPLARQALDAYRAGYEFALDTDDEFQIAYNGVNLAFMQLALEEGIDRDVLQRVLDVTASSDDYWQIASRADAELLLGDYTTAAATYRNALDRSLNERELASTAQQARMVIDLRDRPDGSTAVLELFEDRIGTPDELASVIAGQEDEALPESEQQ